MVSQIIGILIIYSTVCLAADEREHQTSASLRSSNSENVSIWGHHHVHIRQLFPSAKLGSSLCQAGVCWGGSGSSALLVDHENWSTNHNITMKIEHLYLLTSWSFLTYLIYLSHDDVIKWKHLPCYWPFVRGIHRSPVNSPHKGQWRGALMFSLICARINSWVNNREAGDLRHHRTHYDVIVMWRVFHYTWRAPQNMMTDLYYDYCSKLDDGSISVLGSHHLISNRKYTTWWLIFFHLQKWNTTKTHLGSSQVLWPPPTSTGVLQGRISTICTISMLINDQPWRCHDMEMLFTKLTLWERNAALTARFPSQRDTNAEFPWCFLCC